MSSRTLLPALLALAAAAPAAVAAGEMELFTADVRGTITVGADGSVIAADLNNDPAVGSPAISGFERLMRGWTFEPVLEDGKPVNARAHVTMSLLAAREKGSNQATYGIRSVSFVDPPEVQRREARALRTSMAPPRYPANELRAGVGAQLRLVVELDAEGRVLRAETDDVALLGNFPARSSQSYAEKFARVAEEAAAGWVISAPDGARLVTVPVRFTIAGGGWTRLHGVAWTADPWVAEARARHAAVQDLSGSGESSRLALVTELPKLPGVSD